MPNRFTRLKDGDELTPRHINRIYAELERWRAMTSTGYIEVTGTDGSNPPIIEDKRGDSALLPAQLTTTLAAGTPASPATGTMTLLVSTGTGGALSTSGGTTGQTVYNTLNFSASLASGTHIWVASFGGVFYLVQASC